MTMPPVEAKLADQGGAAGSETSASIEVDAEELRLRSQAVRQSASGKLSVDIGLFSKTKKFRDDLRVLKEIANAYRRQHGIPTTD